MIKKPHKPTKKKPSEKKKPTKRDYYPIVKIGDGEGEKKLICVG